MINILSAANDAERELMMKDKKQEEDEALRNFLLATQCPAPELPEEITEEELKKRMNFTLEEHECKGASNARTWLVPVCREFWLVFGDKPERMTWITYCPYCGYKPSDKKKWW